MGGETTPSFLGQFDLRVPRSHSTCVCIESVQKIEDHIRRSSEHPKVGLPPFLFSALAGELPVLGAC